MTRYILNDVRRNFADNIDHLIGKKVRCIEIDLPENPLLANLTLPSGTLIPDTVKAGVAKRMEPVMRVHADLMVTALAKLNIRVKGFNPMNIDSIKFFFKKVETQLKANSVTIEHRQYGDRPGDKPEHKMRSGYFFFKQWAEMTPPEIAYWISDPIFSPRPSVLFSGTGQKVGKPRWVIYTNVPATENRRVFS